MQQLFFHLSKLYPIFEPCHEKTCLCLMRTTKVQDQPKHPRSLMSDFVACCLNSIISLPAIAEISKPYLVSSAEQAGLSLNRSQTPKTGFLVTWLI